METLKKLGIQKIYCINLKNRKDRWERMINRFKNCGIENYVERFDAISPDHEEFNKIKDTKKNISGNPNLVGCALSHIGVWRLALENGFEKVLIFEDDNLFYKGWIDVLEKYIENLNKEYDLIMLDGQSYSINWDHGLNQALNNVLANGYIVTKNSIQKMLDKFDSSENLIDNERLLIYIQSLGNSYITMPRLVIQEMEDSNIQTEEHLKSLKNWHDAHYFPKFKDMYK